jgi:hypothetical protein
MVVPGRGKAGIKRMAMLGSRTRGEAKNREEQLEDKGRYFRQKYH